MSFHTGQHNTDMTTNNVLQCMQKTAKDKGLQDQLEQLLGCGDGDISSSVNLDPEESLALSQRAPSVIQLASSQGYQFSTEELMAVVDTANAVLYGSASSGSQQSLLSPLRGDKVDQDDDVHFLDKSGDELSPIRPGNASFQEEGISSGRQDVYGQQTLDSSSFLVPVSFPLGFFSFVRNIRSFLFSLAVFSII